MLWVFLSCLVMFFPALLLVATLSEPGKQGETASRPAQYEGGAARAAHRRDEGGGRLMRVAICGAPNTGKTYLSNTMPKPVFHTDDLIGRTDWSGQSAEVATWMEMPGPWVIEGVSVIRAIRKSIKANPGKRPCDRLIMMERQHVPLTPRQAGMAKAMKKHLAEVLPELRRLGVEIVRRS